MTERRLSVFTMSAVAAVLFYGILTLWVPERWALSSYQVGIFAITLAWAVSFAIRPQGLAWHPALLLVSMPAAWGCFQLCLGSTVYRWATVNATLDWATYSALFFLAFQFSCHGWLRRRFLNALLYFGFGLSAVSVVQLFTSGGKIFWLFPSGYQDLVLGPFVYHNQYSAFVELILPLALYRAVSQPRHAFRYWLMASIMVASVAVGASRAGSIAVLAEALVVMLLAWNRGLDRRAVAWGAVQFVGLALIFAAVVGWDFLWLRFQQPDPYAGRRELLLSSLRMVREKPALGFGLGTWPTAYPAFALYDSGLFTNQAHNDWAQWVVEGGFPLAAAMLVFAGILLRPAFRSSWGLGLNAVLIHCLVDYPMQQRPPLAGLFFALAGALVAYQGSGGKRPGKRSVRRIDAKTRDKTVAPLYDSSY